MQCERCGSPAEKGQIKYCKACAVDVQHEQWREKDRRKREKARMQKQDQSEHFIGEAKICLHCNRGRCSNCLEYLSVKEKQELLAKVESEVCSG